MVGLTSLNSTHHKPSPSSTIKFLCSYGGKILPRYPDGKLRYHGGETRLLAVHRSISFSELLLKLGELCGTSASLRCQLPSEDLDALVSITCNEDLLNLIEEYDRATSPPPSSLKIRAFLSLPKKSSPTASSASSSSSSTESASPMSSPSSTYSGAVSAYSYTSTSRFSAGAMSNRCVYNPMSKPVKYPICYTKSAGKLPYYAQGNSGRTFLVHNGNHWQ